MRLCRYKGVIGLALFLCFSVEAWAIKGSCPSGSVGAILSSDSAKSSLSDGSPIKNNTEGSSCSLSPELKRNLFCSNDIKPMEGKGTEVVIAGKEGNLYYVHKVKVLDQCKLFDQLCGNIYQSRVYIETEEMKPYMGQLMAALNIALQNNNCSAVDAILGAMGDPSLVPLDDGDKGLYFETGDTSCSAEVPNCANSDNFCIVTSSGSSCGWDSSSETDDGIRISNGSGSLMDYANGNAKSKENSSSNSGNNTSSNNGSNNGSSSSSASGSVSGGGSSSAGVGGSGGSSSSSGAGTGGSSSTGSNNNGASNGNSNNSELEGEGSGRGNSGTGSGAGRGESSGNGEGNGTGEVKYPDIEDLIDEMGDQIPNLLAKYKNDLMGKINANVSISGTCNPITLSIWGETQTIDIHCRIFTENGPQISSAMLFAWSFIALLVVLSA